jgi:hypothetical protein
LESWGFGFGLLVGFDLGIFTAAGITWVMLEGKKRRGTW